MFDGSAEEHPPDSFIETSVAETCTAHSWLDDAAAVCLDHIVSSPAGNVTVCSSHDIVESCEPMFDGVAVAEDRDPPQLGVSISINECWELMAMGIKVKDVSSQLALKMSRRDSKF